MAQFIDFIGYNIIKFTLNKAIISEKDQGGFQEIRNADSSKITLYDDKFIDWYYGSDLMAHLECEQLLISSNNDSVIIRCQVGVL